MGLVQLAEAIQKQKEHFVFANIQSFNRTQTVECKYENGIWIADT